MYYYLLSQKTMQSRNKVKQYVEDDLGDVLRNELTNIVKTFKTSNEIFNYNVYSLLKYDEPVSNRKVIKDYNDWSDNIIEILPEESSHEECAFQFLFDFAQDVLKEITDENVKDKIITRLVDDLMELY